MKHLSSKCASHRGIVRWADSFRDFFKEVYSKLHDSGTEKEITQFLVRDDSKVQLLKFENAFVVPWPIFFCLFVFLLIYDFDKLSRNTNPPTATSQKSEMA